MNQQLESIGDRALFARKARKLTQQQVTERGGPSKTTIFRIETEPGYIPERTTIMSLALALQVHPFWLQTGHGEMESAIDQALSPAINPAATIKHGLDRYKQGPEALRAHLKRVLHFDLSAERLDQLLQGEDAPTMAESLALGTALAIPVALLCPPSKPGVRNPPAAMGGMLETAGGYKIMLRSHHAPAAATDLSPAHQVALQGLAHLLEGIPVVDLPHFLAEVGRLAQAFRRVQNRDASPESGPDSAQ